MESSVDEKAGKVRAIVFDVDGVLTRGEIIFGPDGQEWKMFNIHDGHGIVLARKAGLKVALLTGRHSEAVRARARELGVDELVETRQSKGKALPELVTKLHVKMSEVCYVGDDLVDLPAMLKVGLPVAVADAMPEVRFHAAWVTTRKGGEGAAREVIEAILRAQEKWSPLVQRYLEEP